MGNRGTHGNPQPVHRTGLGKKSEDKIPIMDNATSIESSKVILQ